MAAVAVEIIDALEAIEVQQQNGEGMMAALGAAYLLLQAVHEIAVIGQTGQCVVTRLIEGLFLMLLAIGDVHPRT